MGKTSEYADGLLNQKTSGLPRMACQLVVQLSDGRFITEFASYGSGPLVHAEDMLFHLLEKHFVELSQVPANSKIVFYGNWSPCKQCVDLTIPNWLAKMNIVNDNLRLRFRFNDYYTRQSWDAAGMSVRADSGGHFFWGSDDEADSAYNRLAATYGNFAMKNLTTPSQVQTSTSPRVAFLQGQRRSRSVTTWHESYRGKIG